MNSSNNHRIEVVEKDFYLKDQWNGKEFSVKKAYVYHLNSTNSNLNFEKLADLLCDDVLENVYFKEASFSKDFDSVLEVRFKEGVTDNLARCVQEALELLEIEGEVSSSNLYLIQGDIDEGELLQYAKQHYFNPLIHNISMWTRSEFENLSRFENSFNTAASTQRLGMGDSSNKNPTKDQKKYEIIELDLSDSSLETISQERCLALTLDEMLVIKNYYLENKRNNLPDWPTDVELEVLAQTWSEHCKHKIFSSHIEYTNSTGAVEKIDGLYKSFIKKATKEINSPWLVSVFEDNAGIVNFDENLNLCIKVETHNSPSALDPYGGALTGILGVNRDILGTGLGALPIANTDVFCFAKPEIDTEENFGQLPKGIARPKSIIEGVHKGVVDGGNKSGIPTVNGAFYFDNSYAAKPLVFVGTIGVIPKKIKNKPSEKKAAKVGDNIVVVGGSVGADGIHGATFSSLEINEDSPSSAVQIGDPFMQRRVTDFLIKARDRGLYSSITDNGAGGLSSSIGEMAKESGGAVIELANCHFKYPGLKPYEIMISESQERMSFAVPDESLEEFVALSKAFGVRSSVIGKFTNSGMLSVYHENILVADLSMSFLHSGLPQMKLKAKATKAFDKKIFGNWILGEKKQNVESVSLENIKSSILKLVGAHNICSKESYIRQYDHEVKAATHLKSFSGSEQVPTNNSGGIWLYPHGGEKHNGVAVACGLAPRMSMYNPYLMAQMSVDEAMRNLISQGVDPDHICFLDNFCWPDPVESAKTPDGQEKLGALVEACQGLYDILKIYKTPLVSGKDSMKNDFKGKRNNGEPLTISVLPTLLVTGLGKYNIKQSVSSEFKQEDHLIYEVGPKANGLIASELSEILELSKAKLPSIDPVVNLEVYKNLYRLICKGKIESCHDVSEGGAILSIVEACFGNSLGAIIDIDTENTRESLFSESGGRFIISIKEEHKEFLSSFGDNIRFLGKTSKDRSLELRVPEGHLRIETSELKGVWNERFH